MIMPVPALDSTFMGMRHGLLLLSGHAPASASNIPYLRMGGERGILMALWRVQMVSLLFEHSMALFVLRHGKTDFVTGDGFCHSTGRAHITCMI